MKKYTALTGVEVIIGIFLPEVHKILPEGIIFRTVISH